MIEKLFELPTAAWEPFPDAKFEASVQGQMHYVAIDEIIARLQRARE